VDLAGGRVLRRHSRVGRHAHGLVLTGQRMLCLDSERGALTRVDGSTGRTTKLWQVLRPRHGSMPRHTSSAFAAAAAFLCMLLLYWHTGGP
jgi:hypothetical protein